MATSSKPPNQDQMGKPNKNCMIRTKDGTKTKKETVVTQDQQIAEDSVSLDLRLNLISQIKDAFTHVNEINERNRQIINKLDHFQHNSFNEPDLPKKSKETTDCRFQENDEVQHVMETAKSSDCARAIETAESLSRKLDTFCKCFEAQTCLDRYPTSASQRNSVTSDPSLVFFRSGLRRKHNYREDDNSVVLFLSGDIHIERKSPFVIQAPNVSKVRHISRGKNLEADKFQQYPLKGSLTPTLATTSSAAATKETRSAKASTIQITVTTSTTKATTAAAATTTTAKATTEMATSQAYPPAGNSTGQFRRNQTKIKDDNRLVSYEAQIERQIYKTLAKYKNDGGFLAGARQNRLNGHKGARYQFVPDEKRALMSDKMVPKEKLSSEQGFQNSNGYHLDSDHTHIARERIDKRDRLSSSELLKIRRNVRDTVSAEEIGKGHEDTKSQASMPEQWKGKMDTEDRVCSSEIPKKHVGTEGKMSTSKPWTKQGDTKGTESTLESTKKYNKQEGADRKMDREDSELSMAHGNSKDTLFTFEPSEINNGDRSVRRASELLKKERDMKDTVLTSKPPIKQGSTRDKISTSGLPKKHKDDKNTESTSKLLKKHEDSKGSVSTSGLSTKNRNGEETASAVELSKKRVATSDAISSSERSKEDQVGESKLNSRTKTTGVIKDSTQDKSSKEDRQHRTHRAPEVTVKNPSQVTPQDEEDTTQGLDIMPIVRQYWESFAGDSGICAQLDAAGMKMELMNPDERDPNKPFRFKYKMEELGFEQTVDLTMNDMFVLQAQAGLDGSQPFQFPNMVDLNYWPKFCEEEVQKGQRYRIDDDSIDTILCIDISSSMKGDAWGQTMDFARNFVRGIKANPPINEGVQEKIALVTFGHMTKIHKHLTTDYDGILRLLDHLYPDGPSPMGPGLLLCAAAIEACGKTLQMRGLTVVPRIIVITDGIPTSAIMLKGPDITVVESLDQKAVEFQIAASRTAVDFQIFCVPVGNSRLDFLKNISKCTGGKVVHADDWKKLVRWSKNLSVASNYIERFRRSEDTFSFERLQRENSHLTSNELREIRRLLKENKKLGINTSIEQQMLSVTDDDNGQVDLPIGTRVRRGPDWNRGDEDGDGPGTVIGKASAKDNFYFREQCRDSLRESVATRRDHGTHADNLTCLKRTRQLQIVWDKSKSRRNVHIYRYGQYIMDIFPVDEPRILSPSENMAVGCYVERGRDWQYGDQDGGPGNIGIVTDFDTQTEIVSVIWPNGGVFFYRFGDRGRFEIQVSSNSVQPRSIYEIPASVAESTPGTDQQLVDQRNQQNKSASALPSDRTAKQIPVRKKRGNKNQ